MIDHRLVVHVDKNLGEAMRAGMRRFTIHKEFKRNCDKLDRSYGSDWNTCLHIDNPTAIQICSPEHCPKKGEWKCYI